MITVGVPALIRNAGPNRQQMAESQRSTEKIDHGEEQRERMVATTINAMRRSPQKTRMQQQTARIPSATMCAALVAVVMLDRSLRS